MAPLSPVMHRFATSKAALNCIKTDAGRLVGSFIENADGDISVGDESSSLSSDGSYLHALTFTDADGKEVDKLYRFDDTRNALCNIFSEPSEVYENGGSFSFNNGGRIWTTKDSCSMRLRTGKETIAEIDAIATSINITAGRGRDTLQPAAGCDACAPRLCSRGSPRIRVLSKGLAPFSSWRGSHGG